MYRTQTSFSWSFSGARVILSIWSFWTSLFPDEACFIFFLSYFSDQEIISSNFEISRSHQFVGNRITNYVYSHASNLDSLVKWACVQRPYGVVEIIETLHVDIAGSNLSTGI